VVTNGIRRSQASVASRAASDSRSVHIPGIASRRRDRRTCWSWPHSPIGRTGNWPPLTLLSVAPNRELASSWTSV